jgi:hypothetical protein
MSTIEDYIPTFKMLVKNRLGPYRVILKNEKNKQKIYVSSDYDALSYYKDRAFDYLAPALQHTCKCRVFEDAKQSKKTYGKCRAFLTTAAGDIEIIREDFAPDLIA